MNNVTASVDIQQLLEQWAEAERKGIQFPVPLHDHWWIAGHKSKQDAFKLVESRQEAGFDFLGITLKSNGGRKPKGMMLTVAALERFCLAAHTPEGDAVRELYRQSKAKWELVKENYPRQAEEVEILQLKAEISKQEAIARKAEQETLTLRHYVVTSLPEPVQQKILGFKEVKTIEYRDRVLDGETLVRDGSTLNKTALCQRYGLIRKTGSPDYPRLNAVLAKLPSEAFKLTATIRESEELNIDYLPDLDRLFLGNTRQLGLGE